MRVGQGGFERGQMLGARREFEQADRRDANLARLGVRRQQASEPVAARLAGGGDGAFEAGSDQRLALGRPAPRNGRHQRRADGREDRHEHVGVGGCGVRKRRQGRFRGRRGAELLQRLRGQHVPGAIARRRPGGLDRVERPRHVAPLARGGRLEDVRLQDVQDLPEPAGIGLAAHEIAEQPEVEFPYGLVADAGDPRRQPFRGIVGGQRGADAAVLRLVQLVVVLIRDEAPVDVGLEDRARTRPTARPRCARA